MTRALRHQPVTSEVRRGVQAEPLTPRELDVLRLLAKGNTNRQIAAVLRISIRTVENHRANLMGKLGLASRVERVSHAEEHDLLRSVRYTIRQVDSTLDPIGHVDPNVTSSVDQASTSPCGAASMPWARSS